MDIWSLGQRRSRQLPEGLGNGGSVLRESMFFFLKRTENVFFLIIYSTNRIDSLRRIGCIVRIIPAPQAYTVILYVLYVKKLCHLSLTRSADTASQQSPHWANGPFGRNVIDLGRNWTPVQIAAAAVLHLHTVIQSLYRQRTRNLEDVLCV